MSTPNLKSKGRKIYEMPICTICLDPLLKDLAVFTSCGHVFHYNCAINAHTTSRKCPNCRHRSTEVQSLHFLVEEVSGIDEQMHQVLQQLASSEQDKMAQLLLDHETMLMDIQKLTQRNQLLEGKYNTMDKSLKENYEQINCLEAKNKELDEKRKELSLKARILEQSSEQFQKLSEDYASQNITIREKLKEFEYLKTIQQVLQKNEDDAYIKQIRQMTNNIQQSQMMYDMFVMKNGQFKQLQRDQEVLSNEKDDLKKKLDKLKAQYDDLYKENLTYKDYLRKKKQQKDYINSNENSINPYQMEEQLQQKKKHLPQTADVQALVKTQKIPAFGTSMMRSQKTNTTISNSFFRKS